MTIVDVPDDLDDFNAWAVDERWSDGLPLVPPTPARVERMLSGTTWPPDRLVAVLPPRFGEATVEIIAINAVMAGCRPTAMPLLITAIQALSDERADAFGLQATTHPCGVMIFVNGPLGSAAGVHGGHGLFGPGSVGNATIGRAMRLLQQNVGGAWPGETDLATQGTPAKFSFCFSENEAESPWESYRVSRGFDAALTTVTVVGAEGPHNISDHVSTTPLGLLFTFAHTIATVGKNNPYIPGADFLVVVSPEHAHIIAEAGFQRRDVQQYLFERARIPYKEWKMGGAFGMFPYPRYLDAADDDLLVPIASSPDDVHVIVGGGAGLHSSWIPTFGVSRTSTRVVMGPMDEPLRTP